MYYIQIDYQKYSTVFIVKCTPEEKIIPDFDSSNGTAFYTGFTSDSKQSVTVGCQIFTCKSFYFHSIHIVSLQNKKNNNNRKRNEY